MMSVSRETKRAQYIGLLQRWGRTLNLTSARNRSRTALDELIEGSLCIIPHLPEGLERLIDLGSGQGLPAIPLAIETGVTIDLIEADRRKAAFLVTVMAELNLRGTVYPTRIEDAAVLPAQCVTARALAPVACLIDLALPLMASEGCALFLKGASASAEVGDLPNRSDVTVQFLPTRRPPSALVKVTRLG